jgi:hypothetical protein
MNELLTWATFGSGVLVGLADPADASRGRHVVHGRLEQDRTGRAMLRFRLPSSGAELSVDGHRLSSTSAAVHTTDTGDGWAVTVFAEGSEAHLRWLIREAQHGIRNLLGDRLLESPQSSRALSELAATLHSLVLRATLLAEPGSARRVAWSTSE